MEPAIATENPIADPDSRPATPRSVSEYTKALHGALAEGMTSSESAAEATRLVRELVRAELHAELRAGSTEAAAESGATEFGNAVRSVFAFLTEAPTNFHQCTVFFLSSSDPEERKKAPLLFVGSVLMVLAQCLTSMAVVHGIVYQSCTENENCPMAGDMFCGAERRCVFCGEAVPLLQQGSCTPDPRPEYSESFCVSTSETSGTETGTLNLPQADDFIGFNKSYVQAVCQNPQLFSRIDFGQWEDLIDFGQGGYRSHPMWDTNYGFWNFVHGDMAGGGDHIIENWCNACVHAETGSVNNILLSVLVNKNLAAIGRADWPALVFTAFVVGLAVAAEMKDTVLCVLACRKEATGAKLGLFWRVALQTTFLARRWIFLPALVYLPGALTLIKGGDALSVCFNTVALLVRATQLLWPPMSMSSLVLVSSDHRAICYTCQ